MTTTTPLQWSDALSLNMPLMDVTHQEFVDLLAQVVQSPDDALLSRWADLIHHTDDHFGREDQWMQDTGFAADNCHAIQHKIVLKSCAKAANAG